jgi:serine/threonine protein kinase
MRDVLGEGAYGCVLKPSLKCKDKDEIPYDHYISKLMKSKSAKKELSEFIIISNLDKKNKYHLGTPTICVPDIKEADVIYDIKQCKRFQSQDIMVHPEDYRILVLKDGGYDLSIFCKKYLKKFILKENQAQLFWLHIHHLFKGLVFFKKNNIVHYDLKPQNIVFDPTTLKFRFIDFGLMNRATNIIEKSRKSQNNSAVFHWSYPIDNGFLNKVYNQSYKKLSSEKKNNFKTMFIKEILNKNEEAKSLIIKNPGGFKLLFSYIYLNPSTECLEKDVDLFFTSYDTYLSKHRYKTVVEKTVNSIDIYGLGFSLKYVLNKFYHLNAIPKPFYEKASALFETMYSFDFKLRSDSPDQLLHSYEKILLETGMLFFFNKKIENHHIISSSKETIHITPKLEESAYEDPPSASVKSENPLVKSENPLVKSKNPLVKSENPLIKIEVNCKEKEFNPITKRCVKKCKTGKVRNEYFRCTDKTKTQKNRKICSEDKELNILTNRCIKKCKTGKIRNSQFKCVSQKNKNINLYYTDRKEK